MPAAAGDHVPDIDIIDVPDIDINIEQIPGGGIPGNGEKGGVAVPGNHYLCYNVEPHEKFRPVDVELADQFMEWETTVVRPERVCTPVRKNKSKVYDEKIHLVCYRIEKGRPANRRVEMANQRGKQQRFTVVEPTTLCVPSYKKVL